jgi:RHS repeat-associated protein
MRMGLLSLCGCCMLSNSLYGMEPLPSGLSASTPPALAGGAPLGVYSPNELEHINYFNGHLSVFVPLRAVDGRGEADLTIGVQVEKRWYVERDLSTGVLQATTMTLPVGYPSGGYGPGVMYHRQVATGNTIYCSDGLPRLSRNLTRLTFRHSDGTEVEFRDIQTQGKPLDTVCDLGASRGATFQSVDGSAATFVSNTPILDTPLTPSAIMIHPFVSGTLYWADGKRYVIDGGTVSTIVDRNGNRTSLVYDGAPIVLDNGSTYPNAKRLTRVTDSLNRVTEITYADSNSTSPAHDQIKFKGFGGVQRTIRVFRSRLRETGTAVRSHRSLFPELPDSSAAEFNPLVATAIELPNGQTYQFGYNTYGELVRMVLPSGGSYEYDFGPGPAGSSLTGSGVFGSGSMRQIHRRLRARRVFNLGLLTGKMSYDLYAGSGSTALHEKVYDSADRLLKYVTHNFYGDVLSSAAYSPDFQAFGYRPWQEGLEWLTVTSSTADPLSSVVQKLWTVYEQRASPSWWTGPSDQAPPNDVRIKQRVLELGNGLLSYQRYSYDQFNNIIDEQHTAFSSGTGKIIRRTERLYATTIDIAGRLVDYTAPGIHIRNLPIYVQEYRTESGRESEALSMARFEYDQNEPGDRPGIVGMASGYGQSYRTRGNLTRIVRTLGSRQIHTHQLFDIAGNRVQIQNPDQRFVILDFDDRFGTPDGQLADAVSIPELSSGSAFAFASKTSSLQGLSEFFQFDFYTGSVVDRQDAANVVDTVFRTDVLDRPTQIIRSNNVQSARQRTTIAYNDGARTITTISDQNQYGDSRLQSAVTYDGFGQTIRETTFEDGATTITVSHEYDVLGRRVRTSNPQRTGEALVWTTTTFDALDRATQVTAPDASVSQMIFAGDETTLVDPAQKRRVLKHDPLGRLVQVREDPAGLNYITDYSYDPRGMLTDVSQSGRSRRFRYDELGRLLSAENPETGLITYTYDDNDNLKTKTDALGVVTTYTYDLINRITSKSYSDATPAVTFTYDSSMVEFGKGRLTAVSNSVATQAIDKYDARGRVLTSAQAYGGTSTRYETIYTYSLAGGLITQRYPSGRVVTQTFDKAARIDSVSSGSTQYSSALGYASHDAVRQRRLGNGLWYRSHFNSVLQPTSITLGTESAASSVLALGFTYTSLSQPNNNGNVLAQTISVPGLVPLQQTYGYDALNRLVRADESQGGANLWYQGFSYDAWGNRAIDPNGLRPNSAAGITALGTYNAKNQWPGSFDAAGRMVADLGRSYFYDAENRLIRVTATGFPTVEYQYDGLGNRVRTLAGGSPTLYAYNTFAQLIGEYGSAANPTSGTTYVTADHLGSSRVITNAGGVPIARADYLPFGEEVPVQLGNRASVAGYSQSLPIRQRFTGKERDLEAGLDYFLARHYHSGYGRFTAPDRPAMDQWPDEPQSLNLYTYARNHPLTFIDPDGRASSSAIRKMTANIPYSLSGTAATVRSTPASLLTVLPKSQKKTSSSRPEAQHPRPSASFVGPVKPRSIPAQCVVPSPGQTIIRAPTQEEKISFRYQELTGRYPFEVFHQPSSYGSLLEHTGIYQQASRDVLGPEYTPLSAADRLAAWILFDTYLIDSTNLEGAANRRANAQAPYTPRYVPLRAR